MTRPTLLALLMSLASSLHAGGLGDAMDSFWDDSSFNRNITNPSAYQGQSATYYNAGSLFARTNIKNIQLAAITLPSVSAGCGGIDAFMGGFSHINSDQLVSFGKAVIANAVPFAVDLALQTWAPSIKENRDKLQAIADQFLTTSMNSCQVAQSAVSGLAAFTDGEAKRHACATLGTQSNAFADWLEAQHECRNVRTNQSTLAGNTDDATAHTVKVSLNVVWDGLMKSAYLQDNQEVAEFILSLTGTVIYDAQGTPSYIPAMLVGNDTAINALLTGGDLEVYRCENTEACLSMSLHAISLSETQAFNAKVRHTVDTLYAHLQSDQPITESEKSFVELSDIPILAMLIDDAHLNLQPESHLYAQNIAADLLHAYLNNMLMIVNQSMTNLASVNPNDVNRTLEGINRARDYLQTLRDRHKTKLNAYLALTERLKRKRKLLGQAASDATLSNLTFGH
ncbi:conjugative transfer pilus assembly protein TraH [Vibrio crassostreae]|uniref:conjugal transfer protein TraH n=1 Tax=Vibrio crassostreae TaxID=246167 RepID=UPI0005E9AB9C|nr:conjugal transfer protein TraH [Vibrio crassostreae]TCT63333.1 conjugative transfer pilus assembly protein TraH [Vibrio crassostreae]TCT84186.1 conjugative transfer pilus assembly protein TraH [Vibrio crassostreae]TCU04604.1 conjugative transfer pilus assembly protein TraH [Vibrio crassostreae]CAK2203348.1 conjugative transfer pilus assembly protein TraH [Vibrio crassostreae]CAK2222483.1 conjugative transfer pilus assembly protein TraH [Vibrio crassostreae]